jgi:hypothetical protein
LDLSSLAVARAIAEHLARETVVTPDQEHLRRSALAAVPRADWRPGGGRTYSDVLASAITLGRAGPLAAIAAALAATSGLPWQYHYTPRPGEADLGDRIGFAELIGPDGPLIAPACRVGFTLMAPDTVYPMHRHPAIELYLVIAGHAEWATPAGGRILPPGEGVLHATNLPHAMRTFGEPLLALYGWHGDIDTPPTYL